MDSLHRIPPGGGAGTPRQPRVKLSNVMLMKLAFAAASAVTLVLSLWMEAGPYACFAAMLGGADGYSTKTVGGLTTVLVLLPALATLTADRVLGSPLWLAKVMRRVTLCIAILLLILAGYAWPRFRDPRGPQKVAGIREAVTLAAYTPTDVTTEATLQGADFTASYGIEKRKNNKLDREETYFALARPLWPSEDLPVLVYTDESVDPNSRRASEDTRMVRIREDIERKINRALSRGKADAEPEQPRLPSITGKLSVAKKPIPYLVRKSGLVPESVHFAVFVTKGGSEYAFWLTTFIVSVTIGSITFLNWLLGLRRRKAG